MFLTRVFLFMQTNFQKLLFGRKKQNLRCGLGNGGFIFGNYAILLNLMVNSDFLCAALFL